MHAHKMFGFLVATGLFAGVAIACGSSENSGFDEGSSSGSSGSSGASGASGSGGTNTSSGGINTGSSSGSSGPSSEGLYEKDPIQWCGKDPQQKPNITGTEECPSDKNIPGCGCTNEGEEAACFTGKRANRNLGICKDGKTKCERVGENNLAWGKCEGQVLPKAGAVKGADACRCFSKGQWKLANTSPCFYTFGNGKTYAVSTVMDAQGKAECPKYTSPVSEPPPKPGSDWTTDTVNVDCAGNFDLCYEIKAGKFDAPSAGDCTVAKVCTGKADYLKANVEQAFPNLKDWVATDSTCAQKFKDTGGYGEMTVIGQSERCDTIDDGAGKPLLFNRVKYCEFKCNDPANKNLPECASCQQGGSGQF